MNGNQTTTVEHKIEQCWHRGDSIGETRTAVHRATGIKPPAHEVQRAFAELSHCRTGTAR